MLFIGYPGRSHWKEGWSKVLWNGSRAALSLQKFQIQGKCMCGLLYDNLSLKLKWKFELQCWERQVCCAGLRPWTGLIEDLNMKINISESTRTEREVDTDTGCKRQQRPLQMLRNPTEKVTTLKPSNLPHRMNCSDLTSEISLICLANDCGESSCNVKDYITSQLPFHSDQTTQQLLNHIRRPREKDCEGSNCEPCWWRWMAFSNIKVKLNRETEGLSWGIRFTTLTRI